MLALYKEIIDPRHTFTPVSMEELTKKITSSGRTSCMLNGDKLAQYITLDPVGERIKEIIQIYKNNMLP
ncbi:hypothetical protein KA037_00465 [Patescibacteria group bacterium]|nr:hypothetical protein [Patescibacteria group bacterium]